MRKILIVSGAFAALVIVPSFASAGATYGVEPEVETWVTEQSGPIVTYDGDVVVGAVLPENVEMVEVPKTQEVSLRYHQQEARAARQRQPQDHRYLLICGQDEHGLIGIDTDFLRRGHDCSSGEKKGALRSHPLSQQVSREPLTEFQLYSLIEPSLGNVQEQEAACDYSEYRQLREKRSNISLLNGVIKWLVPPIQPEQCDRRRADNDREPDREEQQSFPPG
jgi:hypothetical protein